jgi:hypothetical protein
MMYHKQAGKYEPLSADSVFVTLALGPLDPITVLLSQSVSAMGADYYDYYNV